MEQIIVSIISAATSVVVALIGCWSFIRKGQIEQAKRDQKIDDKLEVMNQKLEEHNGYAQKYTETHDDIVIMKKDIEILREYVKGKH